MKRWNVTGRWVVVLAIASSALAFADGITAEQRAEYWRAMSESAQAQATLQQLRAIEAQLPKAEADAAEKQKTLGARYNGLADSCKKIHKELVADSKGEPDCVVPAEKPATAAPAAKK